MAHITALSIMVDMWGLIAIYNWDLFMNSGPFGGILYSSEGIARVISFGITGVTTNIYIYSNTHKKVQNSNVHFY